MLDEVVEKKKTTKKFKTQKYILYGLVVAALAALLIDRGPPVPPFSKNLHSMDCDGVELVDYKNEDGLIKTWFKSRPSLEYPPEYLPNFLKLKIMYKRADMYYSGDDIKEIQRDDNTVNITYISCMAGPAKIEITCLTSYNKTFDTYMNEVKPDNLGHSCSNDPFEDLAYFENICLEEEKILFFSPYPGEIKPIDNGEKPIEVEIYDWAVEDYISYKKVPNNNNKAILISKAPQETWKKLYFWLIPIAQTMISHNISQHQTEFVVRSDLDVDDIAMLQKISTKSILKHNPDNITCFRHFYASNTRESATIDAASIYKLPPNFNLIREKFVRYKSSQKNIVLHESLNDFRDALITEFPKHHVALLKDSYSLEESSNIVSNAKIYIGNHISNLVFGIWLKPGNILIDASNPDYSCNNWSEEFAKSAKVSLMKLHTGNCPCSTSDCYPSSLPPVNCSADDLIKIIHEALDASNAN